MYARRPPLLSLMYGKQQHSSYYVGLSKEVSERSRKTLNLTRIIVQTMGTKRCIANSTRQSPEERKILPCGPGTGSISITWKQVGNSNALSPPQTEKHKNSGHGSEICPWTKNPDDSDAHCSSGPTDLETRKQTPFHGRCDPPALTG